MELSGIRVLFGQYLNIATLDASAINTRVTSLKYRTKLERESRALPVGGNFRTHANTFHSLRTAISVPSSTTRLIIAEVQASNAGEIVDWDDGCPDWIELWNAGDAPVPLGGMHLSDDGGDWAKWTLPDVTLGPDERLVVFASGREVGDIDHWECPIRDSDLWRYHVPQGPLAADWRLPDFDDADWDIGPGGFGYGDGDDGTSSTSSGCRLTAHNTRGSAAGLLGLLGLAFLRRRD